MGRSGRELLAAGQPESRRGGKRRGSSRETKVRRLRRGTRGECGTQGSHAPR
ncbi:unnamed protein product [Spirodela intermedia]|uniref:Uncharacterized protein n=2 Tax=Spirodela intermedia TaxID=51605 RepID=A0ABN7EDD0_SPIIN|nr:unnamed protein product [Spirodela intermedia]CAB1184517.1 unnamed protein product [Spirodela intermedia]